VSEERRRHWRSFRDGLIAGLLFGFIGIALVVYALNMLGVVIISFTRVPAVQEFLHWAYANLRLSVVPFAAILALYTYQLHRLGALAADTSSPPEHVDRAEKWVDSSASLFFGVGVIWTAIGMRSALLTALGGLDQGTAARLGAFEILRRLVDGGILLALSTTIVGAIGGYLMRVGKTLVVGARLEAFHTHLADASAERFERRLASIEGHLARLAGPSSQPGADSADPVDGPDPVVAYDSEHDPERRAADGGQAGAHRPDTR